MKTKQLQHYDAWDHFSGGAQAGMMLTPLKIIHVVVCKKSGLEICAYGLRFLSELNFDLLMKLFCGEDKFSLFVSCSFFFLFPSVLHK